jgi:predicted membrane protein
MLLWLALFFIVVGIFMFVHKLVYKNRMQKTLGRKVDDRELTSFSAWMDEDKNPKS